MDLASSFSRIVFLAMPGILASLVYGKLKGKGSRKDWEDFMEIMIFSVMSYAVYWGMVKILNCAILVWLNVRVESVFFEALVDPKRPISIPEILWSSLIGLALALLSSRAYTYGWLFRLARLLRVSRRMNDGDVWSFFHSTPTAEGWVFVRDHKINRIYYGWICGYSESDKERELWLKDVKVYNNETGESLYELDDVVFSRDRYELTIETPSSLMIKAEHDAREMEVPQ